MMKPPLGGLKPYRDSLEKISEISAEKGIKVCIENAHLSPFQVCEIIEDIPGLSITLDLGHANIQIGNSGILEFLDNYSERIGHLHIHDNHGVYDEHLIPGDGTLDYKAIMEKITDVEFQGFGILELNSDIDAENGIKKSLEFLLNISS